jgi:hypothetical protein
MNSGQKLALLDALKPSAKDREALVPLLDRLAPCVWLVPTTRKSEAVGCVGGGPLLKTSQAWPTHNGQPLPFLLRVNLPLLPDWLNLPRQGILQVFGGEWKFQLTLLEEDQAGAIEAPPPSDAYWGGEPQPGEFYERQFLRAVPGLCWGGPVLDEADAAQSELVTGLRPDEPYARFGGPVASWIDASDEQECAYLTAHGYNVIWSAPRPGPESLDEEIQRLESQPPLEPFSPGPVPTELQAGLVERAARVSAIAATLKARGFVTPEVSAAAKSVSRLARSAQKGSDLSGAAAQNWIDLVFKLDAWEELLVGLPEDQRKVLAETPAFDYANLRSKMLALEARRRHLLKTMGKLMSESAPFTQLPGDKLREELEQLGDLDRERDAPPQTLRDTWTSVRAVLVQTFHQLTSGEIAWALREIYRMGYNIVATEIRNAGPSLAELLARRDALRWWHAGPVAHHEAMKRWEPLLTIYSAGEFLWGDCGHLIFWADSVAVRSGHLERTVGLIAST